MFSSFLQNILAFIDVLLIEILIYLLLLSRLFFNVFVIKFLFISKSLENLILGTLYSF